MPVHLSEITIKNLLSFGPEGVTLELRPLNVLIGPNGCGKSNLLSVISLIQAAKRDIHEEMNKGGGAMSWFHKLFDGGESAKKASLHSEWILDKKESQLGICRHSVDLHSAKNPSSVTLGEEALQHLSASARLQVGLITRLDRATGAGSSGVSSQDTTGNNVRSDDLIEIAQLGLVGRKDFISHEELVERVRAKYTKRSRKSKSGLRLAQCERNQSLLTSFSLRSQLANCASYGDFDTSKSSPMRSMAHTTDRRDYLLADGRNLALVLGDLGSKPRVRRRILEELKVYCDRFHHFTEVTYDDSYVDLILHEGDRAVPASRLSDGTLRYLCLLAILLHPTPPPLIMIEEPELGLHPDIIPQLGKLLIEASERTQLIITTHSDFLVDCFHDVPESVVVCDQQEGVTSFDRLDAEKLAPWLEKYRLGTLWTRGDIGGNRW